MGRWRDNSGIANTCPKIDNVIRFIKCIDFKDDEIQESKQMIDILESIREDNSNLCEWGNEQYNLKDEFEKERDYFSNENENLRRDIRDLERQIELLEEEISELQNKFA